MKKIILIAVLLLTVLLFAQYISVVPFFRVNESGLMGWGDKAVEARINDEVKARIADSISKKIINELEGEWRNCSNGMLCGQVTIYNSVECLQLGSEQSLLVVCVADAGELSRRAASSNLNEKDVNVELVTRAYSYNYEVVDIISGIKNGGVGGFLLENDGEFHPLTIDGTLLDISFRTSNSLYISYPSGFRASVLDKAAH